jgi:hypothetical protein
MNWTYRCEYVRCGNARCKSCPHGPYWYRYNHASGTMRKEYCGKADPRPRAQQTDPQAAIFNRQTATLALALSILGWPRIPSEEEAKRLFRRMTMDCHPDRGGSHEKFTKITAAWSYIKTSKGW